LVDAREFYVIFICMSKQTNKPLKNKFTAKQPIAPRLFSQYDQNGKWRKTYSKLLDAAHATGAASWYLKKVLDGKATTAAKCYWAWGTKKTFPVKELRAALLAKHRQRNGIKVSQYNLNGNKIAQYPSVPDAAKAIGGTGNAIYDMLQGKKSYLSVKGFYWMKGYGPKKIDLSGYLTGAAATRAAWQGRTVKQYSLDGKLIHEYNRVSDAAHAVNVLPSSISNVCRGRGKICKGYKWQYG
jgi:hypothetical protein